MRSRKKIGMTPAEIASEIRAEIIRSGGLDVSVIVGGLEDDEEDDDDDADNDDAELEDNKEGEQLDKFDLRNSDGKEGRSSRRRSRRRPVLYWIDGLGNLKVSTYAAFGSESPFLWGLLDRKNEELKTQYSFPQGFRNLCDVKKGLKIIEDCWQILQKRSFQELVSCHSTECLAYHDEDEDDDVDGKNE